jgi:hypothetical protein
MAFRNGTRAFRGYTGLIQGPASRDGVLINSLDPAEGQQSYQIVTDMLNKLATKDEAGVPIGIRI